MGFALVVVAYSGPDKPLYPPRSALYFPIIPANGPCLGSKMTRKYRWGWVLLVTAGLLVFVVGVACGDDLQRDVACLYSIECINQREDWREKATKLCAEEIGVSQPVVLGKAFNGADDIRRVSYPILSAPMPTPPSAGSRFSSYCSYYPLDEVVHGIWP